MSEDINIQKFDTRFNEYVDILSEDDIVLDLDKFLVTVVDSEISNEQVNNLKSFMFYSLVGFTCRSTCITKY